MSATAMADDEPQIHVSTEEKLVYMANQMADFFASQPEARAVKGVAEHITRFWDPRMKKRMFAHFDATHGAGLKPIALKAVEQLRGQGQGTP